MSNQEFISRLQEAQDLLREALDILKDVSNGTDSGSGMADAYIIPHLTIMIDNDHGYMSRDYNIEDWIKDLREDSDDDEDTEDDGDLEPEFIYIPPPPAPPTDPATFPHTPEFADKLYAAHKDKLGWKIPAIKDYRIEYGVGLKVAKDAVEYIWGIKEGF